MTPDPARVEQQLARIERQGRDGEVTFADGGTLRVTSLDRVVFPPDGVTKGDLMRYYARVSPVLLPILADRPLALKRYPDGIDGPAFFQQNATKYPPVVRVEKVKTEAGKAAPRFIGGDLPTLLYLVQIGAIALHAWQSRVGSLDYADYSTIDLDPGEGVRFARVVELARMLGERIRERKLVAAVKTSGSRGIHVAIPLPSRTSFAASTKLAERLAEEIVAARPELATLERTIEERPRGTIYLDVQQNARGKSVVSAYSVRARNRAPVSAPLRWPELTGTLRLERFTVRTMPRRLARVGDLWGDALR
ncbi:MAG: non-homologous end-joining DNA ligase, partial [Gemmatimonadota bacterium]|nr:non-homologous end-joining DNA ligase [Gemmatimonadota bacterium]